MTRADQLQEAINELRFLEDENLAKDEELRSTRAMNQDLLRRHEDLEARLEKMTVERDKIQAFAINIVTRLQVVGENIQNLMSEAGKAAISTAGRLQDQRKEVERFAPQPRIRAPREAPPVNPHAVPPSAPRERQIERNPEPDPDLEDLVKSFGTAMPRNAYP